MLLYSILNDWCWCQAFEVSIVFGSPAKSYSLVPISVIINIHKLYAVILSYNFRYHWQEIISQGKSINLSYELLRANITTIFDKIGLKNFKILCIQLWINYESAMTHKDQNENKYEFQSDSQ